MLAENCEVRGELPGFLCQGSTGEEKKKYEAGDAWISFVGERSLINCQERKVFVIPTEELFFSPQKLAKKTSPCRGPYCRRGFRVFVIVIIIILL